MTGLEALQPVQYVTAKGKRLAIIEADDWEAVVEWLDTLADDPRPPRSRALDVDLDVALEVRRLRLERWRIIYGVSDAEGAVDVLAVRRRPPYDYGDLARLIREAE